jgi:hypothetical protein
MRWLGPLSLASRSLLLLVLAMWCAPRLVMPSTIALGVLPLLTTTTLPTTTGPGRREHVATVIVVGACCAVGGLHGYVS